MREIDTSSIRVRVLGGVQHHWRPGDNWHHNSQHYLDVNFLYHLWVVQKGVVEIHTKDGILRVHSGEGCLLPVKMERVIRTSQPASWLSLGLKITVFNEFDLLKNVTLPAKWSIAKDELELAEGWINQIIANHRALEAHKQLIVGGMAQALLGFCWPYLSSASLNSTVHSTLPDWLEESLQKISADPSCTIARLAQDAGFSPAQFRRIFRQQIGCSPRDYLIAKRMENARQYLEHTSLSVRLIAEKVGLNDVSYFSRIFKHTFGLTPSQYSVLFKSESAIESE